jgi:ribosome biogenesis GTPase
MAKSDNEGTVIRHHLGHYVVQTADRVVMCALSSRLRKQLEYPEAAPGSRRRRVQSVRRVRVIDPVAVGDRVVFSEGADNTGMIREVCPRSNKVSRRASGGSYREQLLAANIDQVVPIVSADEPAPDWTLLDRMLGIAEWQQISVSLCLNKLDLADEAWADRVMGPYRAMGYPVVYTSIISGAGKEAFYDLLRGKITLFMGASGVGKSSLLNWLQPGLQLRTGPISKATGAGIHTTTHTELVALDRGGFVGDMPGVREFYLYDISPEDIPVLFRDFHPFLGGCRFRDCAHVHEPDCAVRAAVDDGDIALQRYQNYMRLRDRP